MAHEERTNGSRPSDLSDKELLSNTHALLGTQRQLTARLIGYLMEIEERRLHLKAACKDARQIEASAN